jgi:myosin heavy subunit
MNPKISPKEIQFMIGNREAYINKTRLFIRTLENMKEEKIEDTLKNYDRQVQNYASSTLRPYRILQEFFRDNMDGIAAKLKEIDNLFSDLKTELQKYEDIDNIKKGLEEAKIERIKKDDLSKDIKVLDQKLKKAQEDIEELRDIDQKLVESEEYKKLNQIKKEEENVCREKEQIQNSIHSDFALLQRPLRKYERIALSHNKLVQSYVEDPMKALLSDSKLKIIEVLENLYRNVAEEKIMLKDKKKEKTLKQIKKMSKEYLKELVDKYRVLQTKQQRLHDQILSDATCEKINRIKKDIEAKDIELSRVKQELETKKEKLDKIDIAAKLSIIKEKMEDLIDKKIEITPQS